jgi:hypothetical protein
MKMPNCKDTYIRLFHSYNAVFGAACRKLAAEQEHDNMSDEVAPDENGRAFLNSIHNSIQNWYEQPLSAGEPAMTGQVVLDGVRDAAEALQLAVCAAIICDDDIPDIVKIKLGEFGGDTWRLILADILARSWAAEPDAPSGAAAAGMPAGGKKPDDDAVVCALFIRLLGEWECKQSLQPILDHFLQTAAPHDLIAEEVRTYLQSLTPPPVAEIVTRLGQAIVRSEFGPSCEYLLITLTEIGKMQPDERIFRCLRESFRHMDNKAIGAICLGEYGDGRAVPALRGWLDKNPDITDRQIRFEVLSAIRRLGGDG